MADTSSVWYESVNTKQKYDQLTADQTTEIAIIGGGIHGVVTAYLLSKAGKKVVLLEQHEIGGGDTGYTTAFISYVIDKNLHSLINELGQEKATRVWQAGQETIEFLADVIAQEKIDCDFERTPLVLYAADEAGRQELEEEYKAAIELGFEAKQLKSDQLGVKNYGGLTFAHNAKFHPLKFMYHLAQIAVQNGAKIYEHTQVEKIKHGKPVRVITEHGVLTAEQVVSATGAPINSPILIQSKIKPSNSYVIAGELSETNVLPGLYIDTQSPYHYLRVDKTKSGLQFMLGGEDHPTGDQVSEKEIFNNLKQYMKVYVGSNYTVTHHWGGQILTSVDGLPYIGRHPVYHNEYLGTCFAGDGMLFGVMSANILSDLILRKENTQAELFNPGRLRGVGEFIKHGLKMGSKMVVGHLKGKTEDVGQLKPGEGGILEQNGKKIAVSKSKSGKLVFVSAVCPHMGCIVNWNTAEKTWDCPCHGSRFGADGELLRGPATKPLEEIQIQDP